MRPFGKVKPLQVYGLERDNPLTRDLIVAIWSDGPGQKQRNIVNNEFTAPAGSSLQNVVGAYGRGMRNADGGANYYDTAVPSISDFTIVSFQACDSGVYQNIVDDDPVSSNRAYQYRITDSDCAEFIRFNTGGDPYFATHGTAVSAADRRGFWMGATSKGTALSVWYNASKATGTLTGTPQPINTTARALQIKGGSTHLAKPLYLWCLWSGGLVDNEYISFINNPEQILWTPTKKYFGVVAGGAAALEGAAAGVATATGALTTAIPLAGAAVSVATATGSLTTSIPLAGAMASVSTATGDLTTSIVLSGAAIAQALMAAGLTTAIPLEGAAAGVATMTGALESGAAELDGDATGVTTATGALTTGIPLQGAATGVATATGDLTTAINLQAAATSIASMVGSLTTEIRLQGAAVAQATMTGAFDSNAAALEGAAAGVATATGDITTQIQLAVVSASVSTMTGALTTQIPLAGAAASVNTMTGELVTSIRLEGAAIAQALMSGALTTSIVLQGAAVSNATMTGSLTIGQFVPSTGRTLSIAVENRTLRIPNENRTLRIAA